MRNTSPEAMVLDAVKLLKASIFPLLDASYTAAATIVPQAEPAVGNSTAPLLVVADALVVSVTDCLA